MFLVSDVGDLVRRCFWPAVLTAVRRSAKNEHQSIIFGLFEGGRGCIELLQNALTLSLYTAFAYSVLGLQVAFKFNAVLMVILGISSGLRYQTKHFLNRPIELAAQKR